MNYAGVILGNAISYDKKANKIVIDKANYFDKKGKSDISDNKELLDYIINIYKTLMSRAIMGTYLYICDKDLREYFEKHIFK